MRRREILLRPQSWLTLQICPSRGGGSISVFRLILQRKVFLNLARRFLIGPYANEYICVTRCSINVSVEAERAPNDVHQSLTDARQVVCRQVKCFETGGATCFDTKRRDRFIYTGQNESAGTVTSQVGAQVSKRTSSFSVKFQKIGAS